VVIFVPRWRRRAKAVAVALVAAALSTVSSAAHADPWMNPPPLRAGLSPPRLPAPFILPELSHPLFDVRMDWLLGGIVPEDAGRPLAVAAIARPSLEANVLVPRRIYVGVTYPFASALPPDGGLAPGEIARPSGTRTIAGNVETHVRAVFPLPTWLEIGFMLGVVAPTSTLDRSHRPNRSAVDALSSLDPTNYVHFQPDRVALRPAGDLRILRGPLVFQGRHGIDILIDDEGIERAKLAGRLLGHLGYLLSDDVEVSVEASQVYFFASDEKVNGAPSAERAFAERYRISDERRSAVTIGPALRLAFRDVDVGAALVTNLNDPLSPAAAGFIGLNVSVVGHIGRVGNTP